MSMHKIPILIVSVTLLAAGVSAGQEKKSTDSKTQQVALADDLAAQAPADWKFQKTQRPFRTHEVVLPAAEKGTTEGFMFVSHFGKGRGGDLESNLKRWYGMVEQPDGSSTEKASKKHEIKLEGGSVVWLDMSGVYLDRPTPMSEDVTRRPNYRVFAAMIDAGKDGPYWIRAYGPDSVMKSHREGFERFLKSIAKK